MDRDASASTSWLDRSIDWHKTRDPEIPWVAAYDGRRLALHLGDFPAEPLYTLFVDGTRRTGDR